MKEPPTPDLPLPEAPRTGGFASLMPKDEDLDYVIQLAREMDSMVSSRGVTLRFEPERGPAPNRPTNRTTDAALG